MSEIEWFLPIFTVSEANSREHWHKKAVRHDMQRRWVKVKFLQEKPTITLPCQITLTRIGKRKLDSDNLPISMKWIRDAIADNIFPGLPPGRADDDERLVWKYDQKITKIRELGVIISFKSIKNWFYFCSSSFLDS